MPTRSATDPQATTPMLLPLLGAATALVLWASAFVAIRHLGRDISPGALSLGRLVVGSLCLGAVLTARGWRRPVASDWPRLVTIGLLWFGIYNVALNEGERRVDAGTAAMLIQVAPVLIALLAVLVLKEQSTATLWVGLACAFAGVVVISVASTPDGDRDPLGVGLCLLAAAAYAVSLVVQKPVMARLSALQVTWVACTVGAVACLPFAPALVREAADLPAVDLGWWVYLGVFPTAIAFTAYGYALTHIDASRLGVTTYLVPPITVAMSWVLLAEAPSTLAYVGGAMCLTGVALTRRRPRRTRTDPAPSAA